MFSSQFQGKYRDAMRALARSMEAVVEVDLEAWGDFIEKCEEGYPDDLAHYDYEIDIRNVLEIAADDEVLKNDPGYVEFASALAELDRRFMAATPESRPVFRREKLKWWDLRFPSRGGRRFVDDVLARCGLVVTEIPDSHE